MSQQLLVYSELLEESSVSEESSNDDMNTTNKTRNIIATLVTIIPDSSALFPELFV